MDVYRFINSKDVREYLRETGYPFTTHEAAFVVYWCSNATLQEKMDAWQEIINTMPDGSVNRRRGYMRIPSLHKKISEYMDSLKKNIERFVSGNGCIYGYEYHETLGKDKTHWINGYDGWSGGNSCFFTDYQTCIENCKQKTLKNGNIDKIRVYQYLLNSQEEKVKTILLNRNMEILHMDVTYENEQELDLDDMFEMACFDFPTPFRRGDILVDTDHGPWCRPFVLSHITTWDKAEMLKRGFHEYDCPSGGDWEHYEKHRKSQLENGDTSDMIAIGTYVNNGNLYGDATLILSIDLEYYRDPLEGYERQLKVFSSFEKGEITGETLANCCFSIRMEEYSREVHQECILPYTKECMEKIGMC